MSRLTGRGFTAADAAAFMSRCSGPHQIRWRADSLRSTNTGVFETLAEDLPLVGGTLSIDASDITRRKASLSFGGEVWAEQTEDGPLAPFGQFIRLYMTIDRGDGTWFPWLQMGELPIRSYTFEWPGAAVGVECTDWSGPVADYLHTNETSYAGKTLYTAARTIVNAAIPYRNPPDVHTPASTTTKVSTWVGQAGSSRWDTLLDMANAKGHEVLFDAAGTLVIRQDRVDADDDGIITVVGPDVGTTADPIALISSGDPLPFTDAGAQKHGPGGNLVALTGSVTRDGGCNGVFIALSKPAKNQRENVPGTEGVFYTAKALQSTGPGTWGDRFGFLPAVESKQVKNLTSAIKNAYDRKAAANLRRRRGVIRQIDLDMVGGWWLEPDDLVTIKMGESTESHYVAAITFELAGSAATRLRCRQLQTFDIASTTL